jgi:hypothetical protein
MGLSSLFRFRKVANEAILELLESVTLGTNGAHYKHQDTSKRIGLIDNPLFLTIERNEKVIANVTFCVRNQDWYVRYFAFNTGLQSSGKKKSNGSSLIKNELNGFFQSTLLDGFEGEKVNSFYAYIDPNNEKSLWMSENFGFQYYRTIATQSFSRISPKVKRGVRMIDFNDDFKSKIRSEFESLPYYFENRNEKIYGLYDNNGNLRAYARIDQVNWKIERLPGRLGGFLTKMIPFIPGVNRIIRPKNHQFIVVDNVWVEKHDVGVFSDLLEGILAIENKNLILWWVDSENKQYRQIKGRVKWGLLHNLIGVTNANLMRLTLSGRKDLNAAETYVAAEDFV